MIFEKIPPAATSQNACDEFPASAIGQIISVRYQYQCHIQQQQKIPLMAYRQFMSGKYLNSNSKQFHVRQQAYPPSRKRIGGSDYMQSTKRINYPNSTHDLFQSQKPRMGKTGHKLHIENSPWTKLPDHQLGSNGSPKGQFFQLGSKDFRSPAKVALSSSAQQYANLKNDRFNQTDQKQWRHLKETSTTDSKEQNSFQVTAPQLNDRLTLKSKKSSFEAHLQKRLEEHCKNMLRLNNFRIIDKIGQGKSGKVFKVIDRVTGAIMAMKVIEKQRVKKTNMLQQLIRQLKLQATLNHPNIAKLYGFFHDRQNFYILMELGCDGQLYSLMKDGRSMSQESASFITNSLLKALEYMHARKILHRDIKPENIILVHGCIKLCDFGWAVCNDTDVRSTFCGTPLYLSPELISEKEYDQKNDIWAVGVLAFQLVTGTTPFSITNRNQLFKIVTSEVEFPEKGQVSLDFKNFIKQILKKDPKKRLSCKELRKQAFIRRFADLETCEQLCR